jgi:hypothetical protein
MHVELERQEHDRPQDIDDLIFEQDTWHQVSQR